MTQELIANMLGVRREAVAEAAGKLQDAGLIRYGPGRIMVLDRLLGLEARSCECCQVVKTEFDGLLPYLTKQPSQRYSDRALMRRARRRRNDFAAA